MFFSLFRTSRPRTMAFSRPRLEALEDRLAPATFAVSNTGNGGAGSLRAAILNANATPGADTITFAIPGAGVKTINLISGLPTISDQVTIDGTTQPGFTTTPLIELNGAATAAGSSGLTVTGAGTLIRALTINRFPLHGILLRTSNCAVEGCFLGTNNTGEAASANGGSGVAIAPVPVNGVTPAAKANRIGGTTAAQRNVISGNAGHGIILSGATVSGTLILGNRIGTDKGGIDAVGNDFNGILLAAGTTANFIGGTVSGAGNLISGNTRDGVRFTGPATTSNTIQGNTIGLNVSGVDLGNGQNGISALNGVGANTIGGTVLGAGNTVSGNDAFGIALVSANSFTIQGNRIGTNAAGNVDRGNTLDGIFVSGGFSTIGGSAAQARNVISGNDRNGVLITGLTAKANLVRGNFIGTNAAGTGPLANGRNGLVLSLGATNNTVGGNAVSEGNVISGNARAGVVLQSVGTTGNVLAGNTIGLNAAATAALANAAGVWVLTGASSNRIGSVVSGQGNTIAGNTAEGVLITGVNTKSNVVLGNFIGLTVGSVALGNGGNGVQIADRASGNTVGGAVAGAMNVIGGNGANGVQISGAGTTANQVQGNRIGTNVLGTLKRGNDGSGVLITDGAANNVIGGVGGALGNLISGNGQYGVDLIEEGTNNNKVQGNRIGVTAGGTDALANGESGVAIHDGASFNTVGGAVPGALNLISGHVLGEGAGVEIAGPGTTKNLVQGNLIGTNLLGTGVIANAVAVRISGGASQNTIGGAVAGAGNVLVSTNTGVAITDAFSDENVVQGNLIGVDITGHVPLGGGDGVRVESRKNLVGGAVAGAGNVIAGPGATGVRLTGPDCVENLVQGNFIGLDVEGDDVLPLLDGVAIVNAASMNIVRPGNFIAGATRFGVLIAGAGTTGNVIRGNGIGVTVGGAPAGNGSHGVFITGGAADNRVGGRTPAAGNTIAHNGGDGVLIGTDAALGFATPPGGGNSVLGNSIFDNAGLGIDLGPNDGVTPNDDESDGLQNFPVLNLALFEDATVLIQGTLTSTANRTFRIEFFSNPAGSSDQGKFFLGALTVRTKTAGNVSFSFAVTVDPLLVMAGDRVTATATDLLTGDTSEFSAGTDVL